MLTVMVRLSWPLVLVGACAAAPAPSPSAPLSPSPPAPSPPAPSLSAPSPSPSAPPSPSPLAPPAALPPLAPTAPTEEACTRSFGTDADLRAAREGKAITIGALIANHPTSGRFTVEGFAQTVHRCEPCPPGAMCKPCEDDLWIAPVAGAYKGSLSTQHDLHIYVHDASKFVMLNRYRLTIVLCSHKSPEDPLPDLELRGYR